MISNGLFVGGVVLDCNNDTGEPEHIISMDLGIYWEGEVWILVPRNNFLEKVFRGICYRNFSGEGKWMKKIIPLGWLDGKVGLYAKLPIVETQHDPPIISPYFPIASPDFMKRLENSKSNLFNDYQGKLKFDYFSKQ